MTDQWIQIDEIWSGDEITKYWQIPPKPCLVGIQLDEDEEKWEHELWDLGPDDAPQWIITRMPGLDDHEGHYDVEQIVGPAGAVTIMVGGIHLDDDDLPLGITLVEKRLDPEKLEIHREYRIVATIGFSVDVVPSYRGSPCWRFVHAVEMPKEE